MITKYYLFIDKSDRNFKYYYRYNQEQRLEIAFAGAAVLRIERTKADRPPLDERDEFDVKEIDSYEFEIQLTLVKMLLK